MYDDYLIFSSNIQKLTYGLTKLIGVSSINNIEFNYPSNWNVESTDNNMVTVKPFNVSTVELFISFENYDFQDNSDNLMTYADEKFPTIQSKKMITINGFPVYRLDESSNQIRNTYFVTIKDDIAYIFKSSISLEREKEYYNYSALAFQIFESFLKKLTEPNPLQNVGVDVRNIRDIEINPGNNKVYVSKYRDSNITVMDGTNANVLGNITMKGIIESMVVAPLYNFLYVLSSNNSIYNITVIDSTTDNVIIHKVIGNFSQAGNDMMFDVSADNVGYITEKELGQLYKVDFCPRMKERDDCIESLSNYPEDIEIINKSIDTGSRVLLTNKYVSDEIVYLLINKMSREGSLIVFENEENRTIPIEDYPKDLAINPFNEKIYILNSRYIEILDSISLKTINKIELPKNTNFNHLLFNPLTNVFLLTDRASNKVFVIDEQTESVHHFVIGKHYHGENTRFIKKMSLNPKVNTVYIADQLANKLFLINGSENAPSAIVKFTVNPPGAGDIYCHEKKVTAMQAMFSLNEKLICYSYPNEGYTFDSWRTNLATNDAEHMGKNISMLDFLSNAKSDNMINLKVEKFGNLTGEFERSSTIYELSSQTLNQLYLLFITPIIAYLVPQVAKWMNILIQRKHFNNHLREILDMTSNKNIDTDKRNLAEETKELKNDILISFSKGHVNELQYKVLNDKIDEYLK